MKNIYVTPNEKNLETLIKNGCSFGISKKDDLLKSEFIAVNEFGNLYGFSKLQCEKFNLKYIEL